MDILNLPGVKTEYTTQHVQDKIVRAIVTDTPAHCPYCDHAELYEFGTRRIRYIDLPMHGDQTLIDLKRQRYRCRKCLRTFFPKTVAFDEDFRLTARAVKWIEETAPKQTFTQIAQHIGIHERAVRRVFWRYAQAKEKELRPVAGRVIGLDELHLSKIYRCIITNVEKRTIIDMLKDRHKKTVIAYLKQLDGIDKVEVACIDMWGPYDEAVRAVMPKAMLVIDKFHVLKHANEAMESVRIATQKSLPAGRKLDLMRSRYILLRTPDSLKDEEKEKIAVWRKLYPELLEAYDAKTKLFDIYRLRDLKEASKAYDAWEDELSLSIAKAFYEVRKNIRNWKTEIFRYFDSRFTNAYTEALNGIAKYTQRQGRGYSFEVLRFKLMYGHKLHAFEKLSVRARLANLGIPFSTFDEDWERIMFE